jgi:CubicO group peptidase (beta-lactamase class C family)
LSSNEEQMNRICAEFEKTGNFSGTCLVKREDSVLSAYACGLAHKGFNAPNTMNTLFNTASVGKVFTAVSVLLLIERGEFIFSDRITELVDLKGTEIPDDVTVEHLLTHSSGIADDADEEDGEDYSALFVDRPNYSIRNTVDFLPQFAYKKPRFKAGTGIRYNNCAFVLLGLAVEKYSGRDYRSFVAENILGPCRLENTAFCSIDEVSVNTAEGYIAITGGDGHFMGWKKSIYLFPPIGTPDGGIYSTAPDLDKFMRSLVNRSLLSDKYSELIMRPHSEFTWNKKCGRDRRLCVRPGYALEFAEDDGKPRLIFKEGSFPGFVTIMSYYPEIGTTVNILSNHDFHIWELHRRLEAVIMNS